MRIATTTTSDALISQIQNLTSRQALLQNQVSTGESFTNPSDNPDGMAQLLNLDNEQSKITQYQSNANRALNVSQASYAALTQLKSISDRAGELVTLGQGTGGASSNTAYAQEVNQMIESAVQTANTTFGNDYLFSGTAVTTAPITVSRDSSGNVTSVAYAGNNSQSTIPLSDTSSISNGTSSTTNNGIQGFITNLISLRDALNSNSQSSLASTQTSLVSSEDNLVDSLSSQGAIQTRIQANQTQQTSRSQQIQQQQSDISSTDMATAVVKLTQTSTAYQAALASASKIMQTSLLDYLT
jgi:flagellar hook-associated protein 3 FlgL